LAFLYLSVFLWLITTICFIGAWDHVAALTTFPQWSWAIIGILSLAIAWRLIRRWGRRLSLLFLLWLVTILIFADNLRPVLRGVIRSSPFNSPPPSGTLRIVTLNCASSPSAASETMRFAPDILLLQEIPASNKLAQLAREWFGDTASLVAGLDCAIVSRYPLKPIDERPPIHYTRAVLVLATNRELLITSLRLTPPLGAMDLWRPATWRAYLEDRRLRRRQLQSALDAQSIRPDLPQIVGGDFNAPANDGIYRLLRQYKDAHGVAGQGWGGTAINSMPAFRPDQIWVRSLHSTACRAIRTVHSDHRMVIADLTSP